MFTKYIADDVLGKLDPSSMPDVAVQALVEGYDSPSLRILAGETYACMDPGEVVKLFHHTRDELGLSMSVEYAVHTLVCYWTKEIIDGLISPYGGLFNIVYDVYQTAQDLGNKLDEETLGISALFELEYEYYSHEYEYGDGGDLSEWQERVVEEARRYQRAQCAQ
jgi:hypothetical protein